MPTGRCRSIPIPHFDPAAKTDTNHPHYGDPDYAEQFYTDYPEEVKASSRSGPCGGDTTNGPAGVLSAAKTTGVSGTTWGMNGQGDEPGRTDLHSTGEKEEAAVTPAQHPSTLIGKSWTREHGEPELNEFDLPVPTHVPWLGKTVEHPEGYGIYFQQRWDEALQANPQFLYINDWNEWTAGKYQPGEGKTVPFMRRNGTYFFVDQYNSEFNRCVQPMKGGYTDNYYMQMAQNIRRYKGVRPVPELSGMNTMVIDGQFADWLDVEVEYRDTIGDTIHRDYPGYGGLHYANDSGRNDIVTSKVAVDSEHIYLLAETREPLTPHTDKHWMLLLIDADQNHATGWYGYDYLINRRVIDANLTTLMRYDASSPEIPWVEQAQLPYRYANAMLELAIPRQVIAQPGDAFRFDFHWCDNPADLKDPISLCVNGDSARTGVSITAASGRSEGKADRPAVNVCSGSVVELLERPIEAAVVPQHRRCGHRVVCSSAFAFDSAGFGGTGGGVFSHARLKA